MKVILITLTFLGSFALVAQVEETRPVPPPPPVLVPITVKSERDVKSKDRIVEFPDIEAEFRGGASAMKEFIQRNVVYPELARELGIQGRVYVYFIVERNGKVTSAHVREDTHVILNQEAIRLVKQMPKWKPAKENGKRVRSRFRLPITFALN